MSLFSVVQERFEKIDRECLRAVLMEQGGLLRADANRVVNNDAGILWERFQFDEARSVVAELASHDYATRVVPSESLPKVVKPRVISWLQIDHDALRVPWVADAQWTKDQIKKSDEPTIAVPWTSVFVISSGAVGQVVAKFASQNLAHKLEDERPSDRDAERECRMVPVTDLIAIGDRGQYLHVRIAEKLLNYKRILEPNPELDTTFKKYLAILDELVARSTAALVSPPTRRMLVERKNILTLPRSIASARVDQAAFERYNRWLMLLVVFNEQAAEEA